MFKNEFIGTLVYTVSKTFIDAQISVNVVPESNNALDVVIEKDTTLFIAVEESDCTLWLEDRDGNLLPTKHYALHQSTVDKLVRKIKKQLY